MTMSTKPIFARSPPRSTGANNGGCGRRCSEISTTPAQVRGRLSSPLEHNQVANKQGVAKQRAREFERHFPDRRKQPSLVALHDRKPRAPSRCAGHRKVLRTRRISGDIYRIANSPSELTRGSLRFRESKRAPRAGFEPATY